MPGSFPNRFAAVAAVLFAFALTSCSSDPIVQAARPTKEDRAEEPMRAPSGTIPALLRTGEALRQAGDFNNALGHFRRAHQIDLFDPVPLVRIGVTLNDLGRYNEAAQAFEDAIALAHNDTEALRGLASALIALNQPSLAVDNLKAALDIERDHRTYNALGVAYDHLGDHETAKEYYGEGLELFPDNLTLLNNLGLSQILSGDYEAAIGTLVKASQTQGAGARQRQNLALAYGLAGREQEAARVLRLDLDSRQIQSNLAYYGILRAADESALMAAVMGVHVPAKTPAPPAAQESGLSPKDVEIEALPDEQTQPNVLPATGPDSSSAAPSPSPAAAPSRRQSSVIELRTRRIGGEYETNKVKDFSITAETEAQEAAEPEAAAEASAPEDAPETKAAVREIPEEEPEATETPAVAEAVAPEETREALEVAPVADSSAAVAAATEALAEKADAHDGAADAPVKSEAAQAEPDGSESQTDIADSSSAAEADSADAETADATTEQAAADLPLAETVGSGTDFAATGSDVIFDDMMVDRPETASADTGAPETDAARVELRFAREGTAAESDTADGGEAARQTHWAAPEASESADIADETETAETAAESGPAAQANAENVEIQPDIAESPFTDETGDSYLTDEIAPAAADVEATGSEMGADAGEPALPDEMATIAPQAGGAQSAPPLVTTGYSDLSAQGTEEGPSPRTVYGAPIWYAAPEAESHARGRGFVESIADFLFGAARPKAPGPAAANPAQSGEFAAIAPAAGPGASIPADPDSESERQAVIGRYLQRLDSVRAADPPPDMGIVSGPRR